MDFIANEIYFGPGVLKTYQRLLSMDVLRKIWDMYHHKKHYLEVLDINVLT